MNYYGVMGKTVERFSPLPSPCFGIQNFTSLRQVAIWRKTPQSCIIFNPQLEWWKKRWTDALSPRAFVRKWMQQAWPEFEPGSRIPRFPYMLSFLKDDVISACGRLYDSRELRIYVVMRFYGPTHPHEWFKLLVSGCFYRVTVST